MKTADLIAVATSLPVEERALMVDSLLRSLNATSAELDRQWTEVAAARLTEVRSGAVQTLAVDDVFARVLRR